MGSLGSITALEAYRHSLAGVATLSADEERDLALRWRHGDQRAGRRLIEASLPFVITVANEYRRWGVPLEDLIQQGNLGLLKGAMRYDPARDCRLITYAVYWIRAEIRDYVVRAYRVVRIGGSKGERRALRAFRRTREDDPEKLAAVSGMTPDRVRALLPMLKQRDVSLDASVDGETPAIERLRDQGPSPEDIAGERSETRAQHERLEGAMQQLNPRERWIVEQRVLGDDVTLESLGKKLGVSKERVRQIEARAFEKLRGSLAA